MLCFFIICVLFSCTGNTVPLCNPNGPASTRQLVMTSKSTQATLATLLIAIINFLINGADNMNWVFWRILKIISIFGSLLLFQIIDAWLPLIKMIVSITKLAPWLMEPKGSILDKQGLPNNPYPEPNQLSYSYLSLFL